MGFIIFEKHPGDLLEIVNSKKRAILIKINQFNLIVNSIKLTSNLEFKVHINIPQDKDFRRNLASILNDLSRENIILNYVIE